MPDQEFKLLITGDATGAVAATQQAGDSVKRLKVDTSDLSDTTKRSLGLLPEVNDNIKKGGEAAKEAGLNHRELRKVLGEIGNTAAPGAGAALGELAFGPVGAAIALLMLFGEIKKKLDEDAEAADHLSDELSKPDTTGIVGVQKAWDDATKAYGDYLAKLATAGQDKDPIKTEVERAKQIVLARLEGQKKIAETMGDKAGVDYLTESIARTSGTNAMVEQGLREKAQPGYEQDAAAARNAAMAADRKFEDDQKRLTAARDAANPETDAGKALQKKINEAADELTSAQTMPLIMGQGGSNEAARQAAIEEAQNKKEKVDAELQRYKEEQAQLEANEVERQRVKAAADQAAQEKEAQAIQNKVRLNQLPGEINQDTKVEDIHEHTEKVVQILNAHGGTMNETLQQLASATGKTQQQTLNIVQGIINGQATFEQRMAQLEAQLLQAGYNTR